MHCYLGIDGGGTRTSAWLADEEGRVLARVETGPSNPNKAGIRAAEREILNAFRSSLRAAGIPQTSLRASRPPLVLAVCAGISGVDRAAVHGPLFKWIRRHLPARRHLLTSDAAIALAAAVGASPGIIVIAGTGSIAFARDERGQTLRAGGWGNTFDDRGSGYDLGRKAVAAALEAFDGRGPHTTLAERICEALDLSDITEVVPRQLDPQQIAGLFPLVMEAARDGDRVACQLCDAAACELANLAVALLERAGWTRRALPVVLTGGVLRSSIRIRRALARRLRRFAPQARIEQLERPPVVGALWLARSLGADSSLGKTNGRK